MNGEVSWSSARKIAHPSLVGKWVTEWWAQARSAFPRLRGWLPLSLSCSCSSNSWSTFLEGQDVDQDPKALCSAELILCLDKCVDRLDLTSLERRSAGDCIKREPFLRTRTAMEATAVVSHIKEHAKCSASRYWLFKVEFQKQTLILIHIFFFLLPPLK